MTRRRRQLEQANSFSGNTIYVDAASGNDGNAGSLAAPVATIAQASALLSVYLDVTDIAVAAGTYNELVSSVKPGIAYSGASGAIVDGASTRQGFYVTHADITVVGFEIANCTDGIRVYGSDATGVTLDSLTVHDCDVGLLFRTAAEGGTITDCTVYDCASFGIAWYEAGAGVCEDCECYGIGVRSFYAYNGPNCTFRDCYAHDGANAAAYGFEVEGGSDDATLIRCWSYNLKHGFISKTSARTRWEACVAWDISSFGFYCKAGVDAKIWHCDVYSSNYAVSLRDNAGVAPGSTGAAIKNCIFAGNICGIDVQDDGSEVGLNSDYNDFHGNTYVGIWLATALKTTLADWRTASSQDANSYAVDPAFVTTVQGGFALPPGSALENAGTDLGGTDPTPDLGWEGSSLP